jgi:hypothetical protein
MIKMSDANLTHLSTFVFVVILQHTVDEILAGLCMEFRMETIAYFMTGNLKTYLQTSEF